ncbi:MAG: SGNH/GDSL hydrolase family protein [Beijerinckiaceae bacterium]
MSSRSLPRFVRLFFVPACLIAVAAVIALSPAGNDYRLAEYELLAFATAVYVAVVFNGKLRTVATLTASLAFGLTCIEVSGVNTAPSRALTSKGLTDPQPVVGWGPAAAGIYHARKVDRDGRLIYDVDYTIDSTRLRRTISAASGPTIAFFGDSFTFGEGVRDEDTLPQAFADADRHWHVLNFGFSAYGPQQFLRAVETGLYDRLLANAKVFVFQTSAWHSERSSCLADFVLSAPRYELRGGEPVYTGPCAEGLTRRLRGFLANSGTFRKFVEPVLLSIGPRDIDLYIAEIRRAAELAREKYGVPTIVLYLPAGDAYLAKAGLNDAEIEARFRKSGLLVLDGALSASDFAPGTALSIPGDGHPTALANRARAALLQNFLANRPAKVVAGRSIK